MTSKLLVIDDEEWIAKVIKRVADSLGLETMLVTDSRKANDTFFEFQPDLVILDLHMPGVDGVDVLNDLIAASKTTRIILTSGGGGEDSREVADAVAKLHGAEQVTCLQKPFRRDQLVALLTEAMADHRSDERT
jgi:CheY-like chemotaxis protein